MAGKVDAQVPGEVADNADAQSALVQGTQDRFGVGIGNPGVRSGEFPVGRLLRAAQEVHLLPPSPHGAAVLCGSEITAFLGGILGPGRAKVTGAGTTIVASVAVCGPFSSGAFSG